MAVSRKRLEYAAEMFLRTMSRQPGANGVKTLLDYSPEHRSALMKCVGAAIKSTQTESEKDFNNWLEGQKQAAGN